tara:strand:+ start:996 stop:1502 length:507 start_codon:yes stop_codon:yes gene_type:complete
MAIYYGDGGNSSSGRVVQVVQAFKTDSFSVGNSFAEVTGLSPSITVTSGNKVLISYGLSVSAAANVYSAHLKLRRGSTDIAVSTAATGNIMNLSSFYLTSYDSYSDTTFTNFNNMYLDSPSAGSHTYKVMLQSGYNNYNVYVNRLYNMRNYDNYGCAVSHVTLMEVTA